MKSPTRCAESGLILPNPTHWSRPARHTEVVLDACAASDLDGRWHVDVRQYPCLVKVAPTSRSHGLNREGRTSAANELYGALAVVRPQIIAGRHLLVIDDVATTGQQLQVARRTLLEHGAASVVGLVLARSTPSEDAIFVDGLRARLAMCGSPREAEAASL